MQIASACLQRSLELDLEPELCDLLRDLSGFPGPVLALVFEVVAPPALSPVALRAEVQALLASHVDCGIAEVAASMSAVPAAYPAGCEPGLLAEWVLRNPPRIADLVIEPDGFEGAGSACDRARRRACGGARNALAELGALSRAGRLVGGERR
jgi:hypothetical protein